VPVSDVIAYVRRALPPPPARVLEIGAGDGMLAATLSAAGYDVTAIDPAGEPPVLAVPRLELEAPPRHFDAAVAVVSLHHVVPLGQSLRRLADVLRHGARLVVDELDVDVLDERAAAWWIERADAEHQPLDFLAMAREHIQSLRRIREELAAWFDISEPVPGAYLYRWRIDPETRGEEEAAIAAGALPAVGARFIATRR
jgi:SAM-dependent methyltransferase